MSIKVETLEKLERKVALTLNVKAIEDEVAKRLRKISKQAKIDGFRPGKVPLSIVSQRYGYSVHSEVLNDKVGEEFSKVVREAKLHVVGQPSIKEVDGAKKEQVAFEAVFEVAPEFNFDPLPSLQIEKIIKPEVEQVAIDRTLEILRKQHRTFEERAAKEAVQLGDRVVINFEGKIDGEVFEDGKNEGFQFILGEGQMLKEFEEAVLGMKNGDSKTFPLSFPQDYHGKDVAGKQADFLVTVKKIELAILPEINEELIKSLGIVDGSFETLKKDIITNLEREIKQRTLIVNKGNAIEALVTGFDFELPKAAVHEEIHSLIEDSRNEMRKRGIKDVEKMAIPESHFTDQAQRRVRLGFIFSALVESKKVSVTEEQIKFYIEELAASYEHPKELIDWYYQDKKQLNQVQNIVLENNMIDFVLSQAKVTEKAISFDELMALSN